MLGAIVRGEFTNMQTVEYTSMAIMRRRLPPEELHEMKVAAYWFLFLRAPRKSEPDDDGFYDLAELGEVRELKINRMTPYSIAGADE